MEIKSTLVLDSKEPLSKAISELTDTGTAVVVTKKGKYYGTIDDRSLGYAFTNAQKTQCETVIVKPPTLSPESGVLARIDAFLLGHFKALPVVDGEGNVLGITTRVELLEDMLRANLMPKSKVSDLMSAPVYTIDEDDSVANAKTLLKKYNCSRLVVVRKLKPVGVMSTLDLAAKRAFHRSVMQKKPYAIDKLKSLNDNTIKEFFRPDMAVVGEADSVEDAAKRMIKNKVSSVVVIASHRPVGVISAVDLFRHIANLAKGEGESELAISGLGKENIMMYPAIKDRIGSVLEKFSGSFNIRNARVHVREKKSVFNVNVFFDTDKGYISLSSERSTLKETVDEIAIELNTILAKRKDKRKTKTRKIHVGKRVRNR